MSRKDDKEFETIMGVNGALAIAGGILAGGPLGAAVVAIGVANAGMGAAFAADRTSKENAIRKKYEGTTVETTTRKKDIPRDIRIAANNRQQKKK